MFQKLSKLLKIHKFAANAVLIDGTEILIDGTFEAGAMVYVVTTDGDIPLPDGEYELGEPYTGYVIVVADGAIMEVSEPSEDEPVEDDPVEDVEATEDPEMEPVAETEVSLEEEFNQLKEIVNTILERLETLEGVNGDLNKQNKELNESNEKLSKQVSGFTETLEKLNGANPLKKKGDLDNFSKSKKSYNRVLEELGRIKK